MSFQTTVGLDTLGTLMLIRQCEEHGDNGTLLNLTRHEDIFDEGIEFMLEHTLTGVDGPDLRITLLPDGTWRADQIITMGSP